VVVGVSGGLDSMCLLDLLRCTAGWHGGGLEVATVDHGTRVGSADDVAFVADHCQDVGLRCHTFSLRLGPEASEATCREARYEALRSLGSGRVALGHHQDDQAETALLMMIRGRACADCPLWSHVRGTWSDHSSRSPVAILSVGRPIAR